MKRQAPGSANGGPDPKRARTAEPRLPSYAQMVGRVGGPTPNMGPPGLGLGGPPGMFLGGPPGMPGMPPGAPGMPPGTPGMPTAVPGAPGAPRLPSYLDIINRTRPATPSAGVQQPTGLPQGIPPPNAEAADKHKKGVQFQKTIGEMHGTNRLDEAMKAFHTYTSEGVAASLKIYAWLLNLASRAMDTPTTELMISELEPYAATLDVDLFDQVILAIAKSPLKSRTYAWFQKMLAARKAPWNPQVYDAVLNCSQSADEALVVHRFMTERRVLPSPMTYIRLLELTAPGKSDPITTTMRERGITFEKSSNQLSPKKCGRIVRALSAARMPVEPGVFTRALTAPLLTAGGAVLLLEAFVQAGGNPTPAQLEAIAELAANTNDRAACVRIWNTVTGHGKKPPDGVALTILRCLSEHFDVRTYNMWQQWQMISPPTLEVLKLVLNVAAQEGNSQMSRNAWRVMQSRSISPDSKTVYLMFKAAASDTQALAELQQVVTMSGLTIPPDAQPFLYPLFMQQQQQQMQVHQQMQSQQFLMQAHQTGEQKPPNAATSTAGGEIAMPQMLGNVPAGFPQGAAMAQQPGMVVPGMQGVVPGVVGFGPGHPGMAGAWGVPNVGVQGVSGKW